MPSRRRRKLSHDPAKVCGSCAHLRRPIHYSKLLEEACEKVVKGVNVRTEDLALLVQETLRLSRERFWCVREQTWTHILDYCSLWQPRESTS